MARDDARVAGVLAAAGVQLRRGPQVVGSPYEYGVPGARHAMLNGDRAASWRSTPERAGGRRPPRARRRERDGRRASSRSSMPSETAAEGDPVVTVIEPGQPAARGLRRLRGHAARVGGPPARPDARAPARRRDPRERDRRRGRPGRRGQGRARAARAAGDRDHRLHPSRRNGRGGCDATSSSASGTPRASRSRRARRRVEPTKSGETNVLVIANETVVGEPLLERIRERARAGRRASCDHARRATRTRSSSPRPSGGCAGSSPRCARRGSTRTVRSRIPTRTRRRCRRSTTSESTR